MDLDRVKEIFSEKVFAKSLLELDNVAEVQATLKEKGVEISDKEAIALYDLLTKIKNGEITKEQIKKLQQQAEDGELSDEVLEQVAGGFGVFTAVGALAVFAIVYNAVAD